MALATKPVQSVTLRQQIVMRIRQAILDGSMEPGQRLVERTLGAELGASLSAVREAIVQLEAEGLITKRTNTRTNVAVLTPDEIAQSFAIRRTLERIAVQEAAKRAGTSDIQLLTNVFEHVLQAAEQNLRGVYVTADFAWHEALWKISGNDVLAATLRRLVLPLFGLRSSRVVLVKNFSLIDDARLHAPILDAIACNDPAAAVGAFERGICEWQSQVEAISQADAKHLRQEELA